MNVVEQTKRPRCRQENYKCHPHSRHQMAQDLISGPHNLTRQKNPPTPDSEQIHVRSAQRTDTSRNGRKKGQLYTDCPKAEGQTRFVLNKRVSLPSKSIPAASSRRHHQLPLLEPGRKFVGSGKSVFPVPVSLEWDADQKDTANFRKLNQAFDR